MKNTVRRCLTNVKQSGKDYFRDATPHCVSDKRRLLFRLCHLRLLVIAALPVLQSSLRKAGDPRIRHVEAAAIKYAHLASPLCAKIFLSDEARKQHFEAKHVTA